MTGGVGTNRLQVFRAPIPLTSAARRRTMRAQGGVMTIVLMWSRTAQAHVRVDAMLYSARPVPRRAGSPFDDGF